MKKTMLIVVLYLAQFNRAMDGRGQNARPQMSDLRDSGEIEQEPERNPCQALNMLPALLNRKSKLSIRLGFTDLARTPAENPMTQITLPLPLVVELPERSPIGCGYCYKHDRIDDCAHRFPHCRTCRCSDCRPLDWRLRQCGEDVIAERVVRFDG